MPRKLMRLATDEFIRRFLIHVLPSGFHRIRHFGLFANPVRANNLQQIRARLVNDTPDKTDVASHVRAANDTPHNTYLCPSCGATLIVIETIQRPHRPRAPPSCSA